MRTIEKIVLFSTLALSAAVCQAESSVEQKAGPADAGARAVFSQLASFYGEVDGILNDGWRHLNLREEQSVRLLRNSLTAIGDCLAEKPALDDARHDDLEAHCAEMLVAGLEELLGPAQWTSSELAALRLSPAR